MEDDDGEILPGDSLEWNWATIFLASDCLKKGGRTNGCARKCEIQEKLKEFPLLLWRRRGGRGHAVALTPAAPLPLSVRVFAGSHS